MIKQKLCFFSDVCTVRLDFESFITAGPTTTNDATACVDSFKATASPSGQTTPSICGLNTGDHSKINLKCIQPLSTARFQFMQIFEAVQKGLHNPVL